MGTTPTSGQAQFALLLAEGLHPGSMVLEYGCGTLHLAKRLLGYLAPWHYCGIDPNLWLRVAALTADADLAYLVRVGHARFNSGEHFDATMFDDTFDVIFAHSVMSHMAAHQLPVFLHQAASVLTPTGKIIVSYREGDDTNDAEWVYPGTSRFSQPTVHRTAHYAGFQTRFAPEHRQSYSALCPDEIHDWAVLSR